MITMKTLIATLVAAVALTLSAGAAMNSDKSHRVRSDDYEANLRRALRYEAEENYHYHPIADSVSPRLG